MKDPERYLEQLPWFLLVWAVAYGVWKLAAGSGSPAEPLS